MNAIADRPQAVDSIPTEANALDMLPAEWVKPVGYFLACRNHLIKSRLALCASLKLWIQKGLTLEDARRMFGAIAGPEFAMAHRFENDLHADLAAMAFAAIRRRRAAEETTRRRSAAGADWIVCGLADSFARRSGL